MQFENFKKLTAEELKKVCLDYDRYSVGRRVFGRWSSWFWLAVTTAAFTIDMFLHGWVQSKGKFADLLLLCVFLLGFYLLTKREGDKEGYFNGFESGYEAGIHRALGVSEADAEFYYEAAMDMKIHDAATKQNKDL